MSKAVLYQLLRKKSIVVSLIILCSIFISEKVLSITQWTRDKVSVNHDTIKNTFTLRFEIIDYEFGGWGEYAYLESCFFLYSVNNWDYKNLFSCRVNFQVQNKTNNTSPIEMRRKLTGAEINLFGYKELKDNTNPNGISWDDTTRQFIDCENTSNKSFLTVVWKVPAGTKVQTSNTYY